MRSVRSLALPRLVTALALMVPAVQAQPFAYVTNGDSANVSVIDTAANTVIANVPVGADPLEVAVSPNGAFVYVASFTSQTVSAIDPQTNTVSAAIPAGGAPSQIAFRGDSAFAYVLLFTGLNQVSVIDTASSTLSTSINLGNNLPARALAVTPDGSSLWVSSGAEIFVIDTVTNTLTATFPLGQFPGVGGIAFTPDGAYAYLANGFADNVIVADTVSGATVATIPLDPSGIAVAPDGATVYVASVSGDVSVIDTASNTVLATVPVGAGLIDIAVTPDGAFVYVTKFGENNVSVIDVASLAVIATIPVGASPRFIAISGGTPDGDGDGVEDGDDICASTPSGVVVDAATGCSIAQLCPCAGPLGTTQSWKNHGQYVSCVAKISQSFVGQGLITAAEKDAIVSAAGRSSCGK